MTQICRLRVVWAGSGVTGGGLTTFYSATSDTGFPAAAKTFFTSLASIFSSDVNWTIPDGGDLIEDTTGGLAGSWSDSVGSGGTVVGSNAGTYVLGAGARIVWATGGMTRGRRVKGSTFICPIVINGYEGANAITSAYRTTIGNAAAALLTAVPTLRILTPESAPGLADGHSSVITGSSVPDHVSWLRSRRT